MLTRSIAVAVFCLGLALIGCGKKTEVKTDQPISTFITAVEAKLAEFETRIKTIKDQAKTSPEGTKVTIEGATEMAEEKIETIRDTQFPALKKAVSTDQIEQAKKDINTTLAEIGKEVDRAKTALAEAQNSREKYTTETRIKIDQLKKDLQTAVDKSKNLPEQTAARFHTAHESAEEALQEAGAALDSYKDAAEDQAGKVKDEVKRLLSEAEAKLKEAKNALTEK